MVDFASAQAIFGKSRGAFRVFQLVRWGGALPTNNSDTKYLGVHYLWTKKAHFVPPPLAKKWGTPKPKASTFEHHCSI